MTEVEYLSSPSGRYLCERCGADITKRVRRWITGGHGWQRIGPETFECICGRVYKTGAIEWDHIDARSRRLRVRGMATAAVFVASFFAFAPAILALILGGGFTVLTRNLEDHIRYVFLGGAGIGLGLYSLLFFRFVYDIWSSKRRTRIV